MHTLDMRLTLRFLNIAFVLFGIGQGQSFQFDAEQDQYYAEGVC